MPGDKGCYGGGSRRLSDAALEISHLRSHVSSHPEDARSMALLANLLMERAKSSPQDCCHQEAISLAKESIKLAPEDAMGYGVLSTIPTLKFRERMVFLRTAVDLEQSSKKRENIVSSRVAIATSLVRLLIEPREELARNEVKLAAKRIMRQDLCVNSLTGLNERHIYEELKTALETAKSLIWKRRKVRSQMQQTDQTSQNKKQEMSLKIVETFSSIPPSIQNLAKAHYRLGTFFRTSHHSNSKYHFRSVLELLNPPYMNDSYNLQSQNELYDLAVKSKFLLATIEQDRSRDHYNIQVDRCPKEYVVSLYSSFAANFDDQLIKKLKYQTPAKLSELLRRVHHPGKNRLSHGLDLGCGTGLSGLAFRDLVDHLTGVDLSYEMISKAKDRGCYDVLHIGDVESDFTDRHCEFFDLVVSCDVFVYVGDLRSVFLSVAKCLSPERGLFAFSTELLDEGRSTARDCGYVLQSCARFAHKKSYISTLATECRFSVRAMSNSVIRKNGGKDVNGLLVILSLAEEIPMDTQP